MTRKFYSAVVPLLAMAAFAVMPVAAQAAPHWNICKHEAAARYEYADSACSVKKTGAGEYERWRLPFTSAKTRVSTWGELHFSSEYVGEIECRVAGTGKIWNERLLTAGKVEIFGKGFENYECESDINPCSSGWTITAKGVPWPTELLSENPAILKVGTAAKPIKINVECYSLGISAEFFGELTPRIVNGTHANGGTTFAEFDIPGDGGLRGSHENMTVHGYVFLSGTENGENIYVSNP